MINFKLYSEKYCEKNYWTRIYGTHGPQINQTKILIQNNNTRLRWDVYSKECAEHIKCINI